jgi:hypothetical protein
LLRDAPRSDTRQAIAFSGRDGKSADNPYEPPEAGGKQGKAAEIRGLSFVNTVPTLPTGPG